MGTTFLLTSDAKKPLVNLQNPEKATFRCSKCNGELKQLPTNPYSWICSKCDSAYTGPLFDKL